MMAQVGLRPMVALGVGLGLCATKFVAVVGPVEGRSMQVRWQKYNQYVVGNRAQWQLSEQARTLACPVAHWCAEKCRAVAAGVLIV